jgi:hypothetical protein
MSAGVILGTIGIVGVVVTLGMLIDRRWSILPRPGELAKIDPKAPKPDPPGTSATAALRLTPRKLTAALAAQRCAECNARLTAGPGEPIRLGDRSLTVYRLTCPSCGATRALYIEPV